MRRLVCSECGQSFPMNSGFAVLGRAHCQDCAEDRAQGFGRQMPVEAFRPLTDPTICDRCGRDNDSLRLRRLKGIPLCEECREVLDPSPADLQRTYRKTVETHGEAKRLARLVVSEIGLYNPSWSPRGQTDDHVVEDLRWDIDRGRQYYNERVSPEVRSSTDYYQEAVVGILGGGDPSALEPVLGEPGRAHQPTTRRFPDAHRAGFELYLRPAPTDVFAGLDSRSAWSGETANALAELVDGLLNSGHAPEALRAAKKALKAHPGSARLQIRQRIVLAHLLREREWYDEAIRLLEDARKDAPTDPQVLRRLGDLYLKAGRVKDAEAVFRHLVETNPHDVGAGALLENVLKLKGNLR